MRLEFCKGNTLSFIRYDATSRVTARHFFKFQNEKECTGKVGTRNGERLSHTLPAVLACRSATISLTRNGVKHA